MLIEMKDLAGLSQPITKLIEVVSAAIGTSYRPKAIRDQAEARAYEIKVIARAEAEAAAETERIEFTSTLDRVQVALQNHPELAERARQRLLTREIEGQLNIEAIADHAVLALPDAVSQDPVNSDWRRKFFLEAENVCEQDLQLLWGKVLAGELTSPGAFGLRTLDTLRQLSRSEAELFRRACGIAMTDGWIAIPGPDLNTSLKPFGLTYSDILALRDAGLLLDGDHIHKDFRPTEPIPDPAKHKTILTNNGVLVELSGSVMFALQLPALVFTRAGKELQRLIALQENAEYLMAFGAHCRQRGLVAKRGTPISQGEGLSVITFESDL